MALTRKSLTAMGIEAEKIDQIIEMHTETVSALKEQINDLKDEVSAQKVEAEKLPAVQKELDKLKEQVEADAKEREGKDYDKLKEEYDNYKAEQEKKEAQEEVRKAYSEFLKDINVSEKGIAKILKYTSLDDVELTKEGKVKDSGNLKKEIEEEWSEYITKENTKGADTSTPPNNTGGNTSKTKEEIMAIKDTRERQNAILENREMFGI